LQSESIVDTIVITTGAKQNYVCIW